MTVRALHPLHRLWRALPAGARRRAFSRAAALLAPRPTRAMPWPSTGVLLAGEFDQPSGIGEGARLALRALETLGVPAWGINAGLGGARQAVPAEVPQAAALVMHVNPAQLPAALLRAGRHVARGRCVIGYWPCELPVLPPDWRHGLRFVHRLWTPSRFSAAALEPWLPGRVDVVPHPLALVPPAPSALDRQAFGWAPDAVVVLVSFSLASSFARKNPLAAIAAFRMAFGDRTDRLLVLKIGQVEHFPEDLRRVREAIGDAGNIRLETRVLPRADNQAMMRAADIVLSLHRSEGFGLVPAEAMLLERAVVATDWSGTTDFLDAESGVPVPYRLVPARDPRGVFEAPGAVWAEADVGAAAASLVRLAEAPDLRAALGRAARQAAMARLGGRGLLDAMSVIGVSLP